MAPAPKPGVTGTTHPLPFAKLWAEEFERLTLWLVLREGFNPAEHLGETGNDKGRDIEAWRDGRRFAFQCKRVKAFSAGDGKKEIAKLRKLPLERQPAELVFVLYIPLQDKVRQAIRAAWGDEATCRFWVGSELDEKVKRYPEIVREFFQVDPEPQRIVFFSPIRAPSQTFVGRIKDLVDLDAKLTAAAPGKVPIQVAITGFAGVGKTELALHYAHYRTDPLRFPGGVIGLDASTDLAGQWAWLAQAFGIATGSGTSREIEPAVLSELAGRPPLLLVLDNAESWKALQRHLPLGDTAHTYLVTTRERDFAGAQFQHLTLGILDDLDARQLLRATMRRRAEEHSDDVEVLAEALAGHSLALEVAGAYLERHPGVGAGELVKGRPAAVAKRDLEGVQYGNTFEAMFSDLLGRLERDEPAAAALFPLLGLFGEAAAPMALLAAVWEPGKKAGQGDFDDAYESLVALHLVDRVGAEAWSTHRLIQAEARERLGRERELEEVSRRALAVGLRARLAALDDFDFHSYGGLKSHVEGAMEWQSLDPEVGHLLQKASSFPLRLGDLALARQWIEQALEIHRKARGPESPEVAADRSSLAIILRELGDLETARKEVQEALRIDLKASRNDDPDVASHHSALALILRDLGKLQEARMEVEEALRIDRKAFAYNEQANHYIAIRLSNLATIHQRLGDREAARTKADEALQIDKRIFTDQHPHIAYHYTVLAPILQDLGNLKEARQKIEEALNINLKSFGDDHTNVGDCRSILGQILQELGDQTRARAEAKKALEIYRKAFGDEHPDIATLRANLASILEDQGDLIGARGELEEALRLHRLALGDEHPTVATDHSNLANLLQDLDDHEGMLREAREAVRGALLQPEGSVVREAILANWRNWLEGNPGGESIELAP